MVILRRPISFPFSQSREMGMKGRQSRDVPLAASLGSGLGCFFPPLYNTGSSSLLFLLSCLLLILCASGRLSTVTSSLHDDWCRLVSVAAIALLWLACDACVRVALFRCLPLCFSVLMVIPLSRACSFLSVCLGLWNDVKLR